MRSGRLELGTVAIRLDSKLGSGIAEHGNRIITIGIVLAVYVLAADAHTRIRVI